MVTNSSNISTVFYLNTVFSTCVTDCPITYYKNIYLQQCSVCVSPCYTCIDDYLCITCQSGFYLLTGNTNQCVSGCPANVMVKNDVNRTCDPCNSLCLTCSIYTYSCTSCNNTLNLYLQGNTCTSICNSQFFIKNNICSPC